MKHTDSGRSRRVWAAVVYSVRRVSEYSSSLRDLEGTVPTKRVQGVRRGKAYPFESDNTPRTANAKSTQSTGFYSNELQSIRVRSLERLEKQKAES